MATPRQNLDRHLTARALDLDLTWEEVALRCGSNRETIRRARMQPEIAITERTKARMEDGMGWTRGSVNRVLAGGEPTLAEDQPDFTPAPAAPHVPAPRQPPRNVNADQLIHDVTLTLAMQAPAGAKVEAIRGIVCGDDTHQATARKWRIPRQHRRVIVRR